MKNTFGNSVSLTIFGESHGPEVGAVLDGLAPGLPVDTAFIAAQMDKRRAKGGFSTGRTEEDEVVILEVIPRENSDEIEAYRDVESEELLHAVFRVFEANNPDLFDAE